MTPDRFDSKPADDDTGTPDTAPGPDPLPHPLPARAESPFPDLTSISPAAWGSDAAASQATAVAEAPAAEPAPSPGPLDEPPATDPEGQDEDENGDEAIRTLLWTAATERPVTEVAALVARLKASGEMSSPADVALRAAAVSRPLDEVRELVILLNESGYDLHQAETTLRAAAVGRPIEDVVELVGIIGADGRRWRGDGDGEGTARAPGVDAGPVPAGRPAPKRRRTPGTSTRSPLDHALATGPGSHVSSPALRSALRWPAAAALFACALVHLPTDVAGLRAGGNTAVLSVVVTVFCLVCAVWLAVRDSASAWAATAAGTIGLIALHVLAGARTVDVLHSSLGGRFAWAQALVVLCCAAVVALAAAALLRHTKAPDPADGT
ncbi:hypothetical protein ACIRQF_04585 [Streptomyces sp. NPDC101191]|uniref:hypothetical protein n=1 Tax=Streptomyces sp. NPDC101191 TaxID=3366126 RepID=UPI00382CFBF7